MKKFTLLLLSIAIAYVVNAQNSKKEDIKEMMSYVGAEDLSKQIIDGIMVSYKMQNNQIPGLMDTLSVFIKEEIGPLMDSIGNIYDKMYTHQEIKDIIAFYRTPTGKKLIKTLPRLMELSMNAGRNWGIANAQKIEERIAPLVNQYSTNLLKFEDFYNPNETYKYALNRKVANSVKNKTEVNGSQSYKYSLKYDSNVWKKVPNETINPVADLSFLSKNEEVYAIVIAENSKLSIQQLKAAALFNMYNVAAKVKTEVVELREVNGKDLLCLQLSCNLEGSLIKYYNYYYSGDWGVLQFIVFTADENFDKNVENIENLLSGLHIG